MTSYMPSITLPGLVFEQPAAAILFPVALGTAIGFAVSRKSGSSLKIHSINFTDLSCQIAKETQKTYMALKQPPYRPPPWVFGPMWTVLYGLMGFAAYRAWTTGMQSFDPRKVQLAKVCKVTTHLHQLQ